MLKMVSLKNYLIEENVYGNVPGDDDVGDVGDDDGDDGDGVLLIYLDHLPMFDIYLHIYDQNCLSTSRYVISYLYYCYSDLTTMCQA